MMAIRQGGGVMGEGQDPNSRPGDPGYVFPKEVHNLLVCAETNHMGLSAMADSKASMLMGASFVVFSITIGNLAQAGSKVSLPVLLLTFFSFVATLLGILTVRPTRMRPHRVAPDQANLLFFGSFANLSRDEYVEEMIRTLSSEEEVYRRMARDLYDHGCVLRAEKYRWLYWSFTMFLVGMVVTFAAVVWELLRP